VSNKEKEGEVQNELQLAATVPDASKLQVSACPRLQRSRDEHGLAKAEEPVAKKNLRSRGGNPQSNSLLSVNKDMAIDCLQQIGINLGESSKDRKDNFHNLMSLELERGAAEFGDYEQ
jgi:hypothetical protein